LIDTSLTKLSILRNTVSTRSIISSKGEANGVSGLVQRILREHTGPRRWHYFHAIKAITQRLNTNFWITTSDTAHSLYVGSYGRRTAIEGFSDLDMLFQLPYSVYQQSALLQAVKTSIEKTYSTASIRADGQVILVPFNDVQVQQ
jgi:Second Messenger Oligonucleotide or Dinucleotide Synthetase domain